MWDVRSAGVPFVAGALLVFGGVRGLFLLCLCCGPGAELHCPCFVLFLPVRALCGLCACPGPGLGNSVFTLSSAALVPRPSVLRNRRVPVRRPRGVGAAFAGARTRSSTPGDLQLYLCLLWQLAPAPASAP